MAKPVKLASSLAISTALVLFACVAQPARLHSVSELGAVADKCGVGDTEVAQNPERPGLLYLLTPGPSDAQLVCVIRWAKRNRLKLVYVETVVQQPEPVQP